MNRRSRPSHPHGRWSTESNPFRTAAIRPGTIRFLSIDDPARSSLLIGSLADSFLRHQVGQIVGDHGSGKSTLVSSLLEALQPNFQRVQRLCFVQPEFTRAWDALRHRRTVSQQLRQTLATCSASTLLVIDGAEQLSVLAYHQLLGAIGRRQIAVLATSHQRMRRMPVLFRTQVTATLIGELTRHQVHQSSSIIRNIVEADLANRDLGAISNVREYWFELYDLVQPHLQPCGSYREQHCG